MTFWRELNPSPSKQGAREKRFDAESDGFGAGVFCHLAIKNIKSIKNFQERI